jgi:LysM repeat protein
MPPLSPLSQPGKGKSNVRIAVITIIALHAVFFGGLLMQGCKQKTGDGRLASGPPSDTNLDYGVITNAAYAEPATNVPVTPPPQFVEAQPPAPAPTNAAPPAPATPAPATPPAPPAGPKEYTVVPGDIPARIAKAHGVSVKELLKANGGLDPRKLKPGQKLIIPAPVAPAAPAVAGAGAAPGAAPAPGGAPAESGAPTIHLVKGGETLTKIARQHGVTIKALRAANSLKTDRINAGQRLKVPASKGIGAAAAESPQGGGAGASALTAASH